MKMETVNIIGAGLAGLSAAHTFAKNKIRSRLISLQPSERAQSVMAEGGINAALNTMGEGDSTFEHFEDTMRGGAFLADPKAAEVLTEHAPEIVTELFKMGTPFAMKGDSIIQRNFGGQKKKRTAFAKSSTGKVIMTALIDEVRKYEAEGYVERLDHHEALEPVLADDMCIGVYVRDTFAGEAVFCRGPVITACGGLNGLFEGMTTGSSANSGDFTAACFALGVNAANLEMIQYHPTTVVVPGKRMLVSEAARCEGGRLFIKRKGDPWFFMDELYPDMGNLAPRDVISKTMTEVVAADDTGDQVYLDLTELPRGTWNKKLSDMRDEIKEYLGIDPAKEPVPVTPGIHFFMGGILVDKDHRTSVKGLYAAGECACQYHGANRLGGNSMLAAVYGGKVAADSLIRDAVYYKEVSECQAVPEAPEIRCGFSRELSEILGQGMGIVRSGEGLERALKHIDELKDECNIREKRRLYLAEAMLLSALKREETRGAQVRSDFPAKDDARFKKTTVAVFRNGKTEIDFKEIGQI